MVRTADHDGGAHQTHGDRLDSQTARPRLTHINGKEHHVFDDNGSFLLALFEFFLFFAWFMCLFWVIGDIFRSRDLSGVAKTFWLFFVIILPWLGILVYLIARGHGMQQRQLEQAQEMQAAQAEYIKSVAGSSGGSSSTDQIASAKSLLDSGAITQAEFEALKAKALA